MNREKGRIVFALVTMIVVTIASALFVITLGSPSANSSANASTTDASPFRASSGVESGVKPAMVTNEPQQDLFGVCGPNSNTTTEVIPADTLVWTTYTINATEYVEGGGVTIIASSQNYNTTIAALLYINGTLVSSGGTVVPPPVVVRGDNVDYTVGATVFFASNVSAGSQVSLAIWSPMPITVFVNTGSPQTLSSPVFSLPSRPSTLPSVSDSSILPYAPDFCGYRY